jgi:(p)ppGpp synthase/HD superfamily hydrolase
MVRIIRNERASPRASWEAIAVTAKAKASIRAWLKKRKVTEFIDLGQQVFQTALEQYQLNERDVIEDKYTQLLQKLNLSNKKQLWLAIGKGEQCGKLIVHRLFCEDALPSIANDETPMLISGTEGLLVNLQTCCHPIPRDRITAKINTTEGLAIHRIDCPSLRYNSISNEDFLAVSWAKTANTLFSVPLFVTAENNVGVLSHITTLMEKSAINIENLTIETETRGTKIIRFLITVSSQKHLNKIMNTLRRKKGILHVERPFSSTMR